MADTGQLLSAAILLADSVTLLGWLITMAICSDRFRANLGAIVLHVVQAMQWFRILKLICSFINWSNHIKMRYTPSKQRTVFLLLSIKLSSRSNWTYICCAFLCLTAKRTIFGSSFAGSMIAIIRMILTSAKLCPEHGAPISLILQTQCSQSSK